jgi:protocatechuate 3,4-dioxygenase beta subunit
VTLRRITGRPSVPGQPPAALSAQLQAETDDQGHFAFHDLEAGGYQISMQRQGFVTQNGPIMPTTELWIGEGQQITGYTVHAIAQAVIAGRVLDEYGEPVMGAQVSAQTAGANRGGGVQTNDLGEYRLSGLTTGDYTVSASYRDINRVVMPNQQPAPDKPQQVYATTYYPSAVAAGDAKPVHVDDGGVTGGIDIKLARITAYSVHVTVVDNTAALRGGIAMPTLRPRDPANGPVPFFQPNRLADGSFEFNGVPPGSYEVSAQRNNPGTPGTPGIPGVMASGTAYIEVRDGNLEGVTLEVKPSVDLQGVVHYEQPGGCGASNVSIALRRPTGASGVMYGPMAQPAAVDENLRFTVKNVAAGNYMVELNGGPGRCYVKSVSYGGRTTSADGLVVSDAGPIDIVLATYNATLNVTVVDGAGNPVPQARVTTVPKGGFPPIGSMGITMAGGVANLVNVRPGTYDVYAFESPGGIPASIMATPQQMKPFEGRGKTVTAPDTGRVSVQVTAIPASELTGAQQSAAPSGAKGSLAGKVINALGGAAIPGAVLTLRGGGIGIGPAQAPTVAADDQGRFEFRGLAPGQYTLTAQEPRFLAEGRGIPGIVTPQLIVGEGQQISSFVFKLLPQGVIAGTVKDESGQPALGARVEAYHYLNNGGWRRLMPAGSAQTDDLGAYRIANLSPGTYYIEVSKAPPRTSPNTVIAIMSTQFATETMPVYGQSAADSNPSRNPVPDTISGAIPTGETDYAPVWYPNSPLPAGATAVRVTAGATVEKIDLTWRKSAVVRLRGKVGGASGASVMVTLRPTVPGLSAVVGSAVVARDGSFEISEVPAGSYYLSAQPAGGPAGAAGGPTSMRVAMQTVEVKDAPIEGIDLELGEGRTVKGTLRMEGGGAPPRPAFFTLRSDENLLPASIIANGDGPLTVNRVLPVVYSIYSQNLAANTYIKSVRWAGRDVSPEGFEFTGNGELEIVLAATAAVLEGTVTAADGSPAGGAGVLVAPVSGSEPPHTGNADANGNFYFGNLPPGDYRVAAWDAATPEASDPPTSLGASARYAKAVTLGASGHEKVQVTAVPGSR